MYQDFIEEPFESYLSRMSKRGCWGDHLILHAASQIYRTGFIIIESHDNYDYIQIEAPESSEDIAYCYEVTLNEVRKLETYEARSWKL